MIKRTAILILTAILLVGCSVTNRLATDAYNSTFANSENELTVSYTPSGLLEFNVSSGSQPLYDPILTLVGKGIRFNSDQCTSKADTVSCYLGEEVGDEKVYPPNTTFTLPVSGKDVVARLSYYYQARDREYSHLAEPAR